MYSSYESAESPVGWTSPRYLPIINERGHLSDPNLVAHATQSLESSSWPPSTRSNTSLHHGSQFDLQSYRNIYYNDYSFMDAPHYSPETTPYEPWFENYNYSLKHHDYHHSYFSDPRSSSASLEPTAYPETTSHTPNSNSNSHSTAATTTTTLSALPSLEGLFPTLTPSTNIKPPTPPHPKTTTPVHPKPPRFEGDLYSPSWTTDTGARRLGYCSYCSTWHSLKDSAYWYYMHFTHGISCHTGQQFPPPTAIRHSVTGNGDWEARCRSCGGWVGVGREEGRVRTGWFRHIYRCLREGARRRARSESARAGSLGAVGGGMPRAARRVRGYNSTSAEGGLWC